MYEVKGRTKDTIGRAPTNQKQIELILCLALVKEPDRKQKKTHVGYSSHLLELFVLKRIVTRWKNSSQYLLKHYIVTAVFFCKYCAEAMTFF